MSKKKSTRPIHKHTLNLYEGDYETIQQSFPKLGGAGAIREIIRSFILKNNLELQVPSNVQAPSLDEVLT